MLGMYAGIQLWDAEMGRNELFMLSMQVVNDEGKCKGNIQVCLECMREYSYGMQKWAEMGCLLFLAINGAYGVRWICGFIRCEAYVIIFNSSI